jgi:hypothetical protein
MPALGIVIDFAREADADSVAGEQDRELIERKTQAQAPRLQIGFLQGPAIIEPVAKIVRRKPPVVAPRRVESGRRRATTRGCNSNVDQHPIDRCRAHR